MLPAVAATVTVEVVGVDPPPVPPAPHADIAPRPMSTAASIGKRGLQALRQPIRQKAKATAVTGKNGFGICREADCMPTETVILVVVAAPEGVTWDGLNAQVAPVGRPEQLKLTVELNPSSGVTVSVTVPGLPEFTVSELAEELSAKPPEQAGKLKDAIRVLH